MQARYRINMRQLSMARVTSNAVPEATKLNSLVTLP
jgi:hypothetical protein